MIRTTGQLLSGSFMDYAMPRAQMLPSFTTELSETPSPSNPLGVRAGGEGGTTPGARRGGQCGGRRARRLRRDASRIAGDVGARLARHAGTS